MTDLSEFHKHRKGPGPGCSISRVGAQLKPADRKKLNAALAAVPRFQGDPEGVTGTEISAWLAEKGIRIDRQVVTRHRSKECRCEHQQV